MGNTPLISPEPMQQSQQLARQRLPDGDYPE